MKKYVFILLCMLCCSFIICTAQHASSRAQNFNDKLFGGEYTYIEFVATKPHLYPVCFAALSTKDTIKIDRSNLKAFIKSIYSTCVYTPISDLAYRKAFERVFGRSLRTYDCCTFFIGNFYENSKRYGQTMTIKLLTGEKIIITYLRITGIFLSLDETFNPETIISIGPSAAECGGGNFIVPISMVDYCPVNQNFLLMDIDGTNQFRH